MTLFKDDEELTARQIESSDGIKEIASIDVIALTVISACIGVNASNLTNDESTLVNVVLVMVGLYWFHSCLRMIYELVYFRQFKRVWQVALLTLPLSVMIALVVGEFVENDYLGFGLMAGWYAMFIFSLMSGLFKAASKDRDEE